MLLSSRVQNSYSRAGFAEILRDEVLITVSPNCGIAELAHASGCSPLWLVKVFCLDNLKDQTSKHWNVIRCRCPHSISLHCKVCVDGNVTERYYVTPFYLGVRIAQCL